MTSTPIQEMATMFSGMSAKMPQPKNTSDGNSFQNILGSVSAVDELDTSKNVSLKRDDITTNKIDSSEKNDIASNKTDDRMASRISNANNKAVKNETVSSTDNDNVQVTDDKLSDITTKFADKIIADTAKELDISTEELEDVLETLGLTAIDLMNPQNVSQVVATVKADGDMMSLIADEDIALVAQNINEAVTATVSEVSDELNISPDEFKGLLEKATNQESIVVSTDVVRTNVKGDESVNVSSVAEETVEDADYSDKEPIIRTENVKSNQTGNEQNAEESDLDNESAMPDKKSEISKNNSNTEVTREFTMQSSELEVTNDVSTSDVESPVASYTDTDNIINQLTEQMKLQVKEDVKELTMKLNPEHLGNVNLTIASKEGAVTAQLTAQNESVRAALESQIMILKENLESQGVKVEAVEVTVASHEFERNLDEQNQGNDQMEKEQERLRKATRKLNINDLFADDSIEELNEEELVTAKMMKADGNSMDYKV